MQHYSIDDFVLYYRGAYILHPVTDSILNVRGKNGDRVEVYNIGSKEVEHLALKDLDWKHVATPALGYRGFNNGQRLYYLTRNAGRRTSKGLTPTAIHIGIPDIMGQLAHELRHGDGVNEDGTLENDDLVRAIYSPRFTPLQEAIDAIKNDKMALGFALEPNWAVTMGLFADTPYLLHFKNVRVGYSTDGEKWTFTVPAAEKLWATSKLGA